MLKLIKKYLHRGQDRSVLAALQTTTTTTTNNISRKKRENVETKGQEEAQTMEDNNSSRILRPWNQKEKKIRVFSVGECLLLWQFHGLLRVDNERNTPMAAWELSPLDDIIDAGGSQIRFFLLRHSKWFFKYPAETKRRKRWKRWKESSRAPMNGLSDRTGRRPEVTWPPREMSKVRQRSRKDIRVKWVAQFIIF